MGDVSWWNKRFSDRELNLAKHEKNLETDIKKLKQSGNVLDIACGDGRNAIFWQNKAIWLKESILVQ